MPVDAAVRLLETMAEGEDAVVALARGRGVDETRLRATLRATTFAVVNPGVRSWRTPPRLAGVFKAAPRLKRCSPFSAATTTHWRMPSKVN